MPVVFHDNVPFDPFRTGATYQTLVGDEQGSTPFRIGIQTRRRATGRSCIRIPTWRRSPSWKARARPDGGRRSVSGLSGNDAGVPGPH